MKGFEFTKFQGLGNDFIIIENLEEEIKLNKKNVVFLCDRHFGVGADGVILVEPSSEADFRMVIYNADGSQAEMCGNGIRCFAKYVYNRGLITRENMSVETLAGIMEVHLGFNAGQVEAVRVNMGAPGFKPEDIPVNLSGKEVLDHPFKSNGREYRINCVSMGNPHCVIFMDDISRIELDKVGPDIENDKLFPKRTNVEFVEVFNRENLKVRVWERGSGITLACGTGACAALAAAVKQGLSERKATVSLPGGELVVEWYNGGDIYMTGPAEEVFAGIIALDQ